MFKLQSLQYHNYNRIITSRTENDTEIYGTNAVSTIIRVQLCTLFTPIACNTLYIRDVSG